MYQKKVITKKIIYSAVFLLLFSGFFSCYESYGVVDELNIPSNTESSDQPYGFLSLTLGLNLSDEDNQGSSRKAMNLDDIAELVTYYEILIFNESEVKKYPFLIDCTELSIPVGNWNLMILGGTKKDSKYILIGSGYYENLEILENQVTGVTVNLYPIDITMKADRDEIYCNETFNFEVSINTRNPYLTVKYVYLNGGKLIFDNQEKNSIVTANKAMTADSTPGELQIKYSTSSIYFIYENLQMSLDECSSFNYIINSNVYEKEEMTIKTYDIKKQIVTTGINMKLNWVE